VQSTVVDGRLRLSGAPVRHGRPKPGGEAAERVVTLEETLPNGRAYTIQALVDRSRAVTRDMPVRRLGADEWLTLGDNRDNAMDARYHGPVPASDICGRVLRVLSAPRAP
jgi:type IV secretory pathway protease TraF